MNIDQFKIEVINKSFDKLVEKLTQETHDNSMWNTLNPVIFVVVGSVLTFLAQYILEKSKVKRDNEIRKQVLISKTKGKSYLIVQIIKDIAMFKTQKQYYIRSYKLAEKKKDKKGHKDSFQKHYDKSNGQRLMETKLDEAIAEYFQIVTEYMILTKNKKDFDTNFQLIYNYEHPKASKFENCDTRRRIG